MDGYLAVVRAQPLATAMLQFAVLGTLGDLLGAWLAARRLHWPLGDGLWWRKMLKWALLAVPIKVAFVGYAGFVQALVAYGWLPQGQPLVLALATSVAINLQFGPLLVLGHRWLNNRISGIRGARGWQNIGSSFWSLAWFWVPAHAITFALPPDWRIGLAALWSVVLGLILGLHSSPVRVASQPVAAR